MRFHQSLKFQISVALLALTGLFLGVFALSQVALEEQRRYNSLLNVTTRLEHTARQLFTLGHNYLMYTPKGAENYYFDNQLYHQEILTQVNLFDELAHGFMMGNFDSDLIQGTTPLKTELDPGTKQIVFDLEILWEAFRTGLFEALGTSERSPRLSEAAAFIATHQQPVTTGIDTLSRQIKTLVESRLQKVNRVYWALLLTTMIVLSGILSWFFLAVLRPLGRTVTGFGKVAQGDFGYQVSAGGNNELALITGAFNQLSSRLNAIFRLIDQIQRGSDLNETLSFIARQFPELLPLDWAGALFVAGDNSTITLEKSYQDGKQEALPAVRFRLNRTLLQKAIASGEPLHVPDMQKTAEANPGFEFLNHLVAKGLRDAIFLPVTGTDTIPGVLAFASREPDTYTPEHLELLTNIASLVTHTFGRTVRMAEHTRLVAIGEFASGITHEIRSPLSTITLALDHFEHVDLSESARKRAVLARQEAHRMERLLEDILLYAKPVRLNLQPVNLGTLLREILETHASIGERAGQRIEVELPAESSEILGDTDRLKQLFLNLARNASEAAPAGSTIRWSLTKDEISRSLTVDIENNGDPIAPDLLPLVFKAFVTTKSGGTGLGLGIVKRIVDAHGGDIAIRSDQSSGTRVRIHLPPV